MMRPDDAAKLVAFHSRLSPESIRMRYFVPKPTLTPAEVARLTDIDVVNRLALVALDDDQIVAVGRYMRFAGTDTAEVAFLVDDEYQGIGIAPALLQELVTVARRNGIATFTADVLPSNDHMLRVLGRSGLQSTRRTVHGCVEVTMDIRPVARGRRGRPPAPVRRAFNRAA